jgi:hypothetical protein
MANDKRSIKVRLCSKERRDGEIGGNFIAFNLIVFFKLLFCFESLSEDRSERRLARSQRSEDLCIDYEGNPSGVSINLHLGGLKWAKLPSSRGCSPTKLPLISFSNC